MAGDLILPVPEMLSAVYTVPTVLPAGEVREQMQVGLAACVPDPVGRVARKMLEAGAVGITTCPRSEVPPLHVELQEHLGVVPDLVRAVTGADRFAVVKVAWPPGWPPVHESVARACAAALAWELAAPVVDVFIPKVLVPEEAIAALPGQDYQVKLTDWISVFQSGEDSGLWMTTKGLGRFGLPELQLCNVPLAFGSPWNAIMSGIAGRLLDLWLEALRQRGEPSAFALLPAEFEISHADIADAHPPSPQRGDHALVRLTLDPALDDSSDTYLTVQPPERYPGSLSEYLADVSRELAQ